MTFVTASRIGMTIQDNTLMLCEILEGVNGSKEINSLNIVDLPEKIIKQGIIQDKKGLKKIILEALGGAKPFPIESKEIVFEVPEEHVFQHILTFPASLTEKQVREAMVFEAEKLLPFEIEQMSWDIKIISTQDKSNSILFTAVPIDLVQEYYDVFVSCGLIPLGFSVRTEELLQSIGRKKLGFTVLLDLQKEYTSALFFDGQKLLAVEQINIGEAELNKAIKAQFDLTGENLKKEIKEIAFVDMDMATLNNMKKFEEELKILVKGFCKLEEAYRKELAMNKTDMGQKYEFLFTGTGVFHGTFRVYFKEARIAKLKALKTNLKRVLNLQTRDQNRLSFFCRSEDKPLFNKLIPGALGAALMNYAKKSSEPNAINLLPPMVRTFALWKKTSSWFIMISSLILLFSICWLMVFGFSWGTTAAQLKVAKTNFITVERQLSMKKSQGSEERIRAANEELKILTELKKSSTPYADIVAAIEKVVPQNAHFVSLRYGLHKDKTLFEWKGMAEIREEVINTHLAIKSLPFIKDTVFPPSNLDKRDQIEFSILFHLKEGIDI